MKKLLTILLALALISGLNLVIAIPVVANDIASSRIVAEGALTQNDDGSYTGAIEVVENGGFDIYARDGATAWFGNDPGTGEVWDTYTITDHDAWPTWTPDTPDWEWYTLEFWEDSGVQKWALQYRDDITDPVYADPMSGTMDWDDMYAFESGTGVYYTTPKIPGGASAHGGGPACWDMDWSWGSEVVPLQYPGFSVSIEDKGEGIYRVTLTPAATSGFVTGGGWIESPEGAVRNTFINSFEENTDGWFDDYGGSITRVLSGTNGVTSADGSWHAEVTVIDWDGPYTYFGGPSSEFPTGGFSQLVDVYIDPAMGVNGQGWALDNALNGNDDKWEEAGGVGALKATDGCWWLSADGDGAGYPGPASGGVGLKISSAGWYTIESQWIENSVDPTKIDRNTLIYDSSGTLLYTNSNPQQVNMADAGGHRYGWFLGPPGGPSIEFPLPIDNSRLVQAESIIGKASFGFVSKYKKGANVPDGNTEFIFKAADLNFHSNSYEWLVVNKNDSRAQFKGSGTINGVGDYKFMLWACDGEPDTFRIMIWYEVDSVEHIIYDNGVNQSIGSGNIIVHKK